MYITTIKKTIFVIALILMSTFCEANEIIIADNHSDIQIKQSSVQGIPKANSIQASIDGHLLTIVFLENLGQVTVEVTTSNGYEVETTSFSTPNGVLIYIPNTGSYIVTFTLPNGDEYFGEFEVTD